jgi:phospholipid transport system substrate-binding protein
MVVSNSQIGQVSRRIICQTLTSIFGLFLCVSLAMAAENPQTVVQTGTDQVLKIIRQNPQAAGLRREKIKSVVDGYFDFEGMSRLAVGRPWSSVPPEKQQEFTKEFEKLLFNTYIGDIEKYAGQRITYHTKTVAPGYTVVEAIVNEQGGPVSLDYSLHRKNGDWKVYDVAVGGMSLAINYRGQFDTILANGSFDDLLMRLKQQVAQVCRTGSC